MADTCSESCTTVYVALDGDDAWTGAYSEPNASGTDGPLATLGRAVEVLGEVCARQPEEPGRILLRGGTYLLDSPVVLHIRDFGKAGPVTIAAYGDERPILSTGRHITGWTSVDGGLWQAEIPGCRDGEWYFRSLFVNGERRQRARLPVDGYWSVQGAAVGNAAESWAGDVGGDQGAELARQSFCFGEDEILPDYAERSELEVVVLQFWTAARLRIREIDARNRSVLFSGRSFRPLTWSFGYYLDNIREGLEAPGSWFLDGETGVVIYHPLPGEDLRTAEVVAPTAMRILRIGGTEDAPLRGLSLRGLTFHHTDWSLPPEGYSHNQAELPPPAALEARYVHGLSIEQCTFEHLGGWAIDLGRGCRDNMVQHCRVRDTGAGCIKVGEPTDPDSDDAEASGNAILDNRFHDMGKTYLGPAAVWIGFSGNNRVAHNEITGQAQWAISVGWRWAYFPLSRARDNIVEYNHVHHLGTGVLGTHGALYVLGTQPGTVLRNNYIHDIFANEHWGAGAGITLDNGCSGILVENNVVHDTAAGGWGCNFNCFGNIIQNNILAFGTKCQLTRYGDPPGGDAPPNGEVFARNLVVWREGPLFYEKDWWAFQTLWDYNLYWRMGGEEVKFLSYSFAEWQARGIDKHSVVADPCFTNPEDREFSLRPESPAFALGFKPIDLSTVGPRSTSSSHSADTG